MLVSFMRQLYGEPTNFRPQILEGRKKHTFRVNSMIRAGDLLQFWDLSPRNYKAVPAPSYFSVLKNVRAVGHNWTKKGRLDVVCIATEDFKIYFPIECFPPYGGQYQNKLRLFIGGHEIVTTELYKLIVENDGLTIPQFEKFFYETCKNKGEEVQRNDGPGRMYEAYKKIEGKVIHWNRRAYFEETADLIDNYQDLFEDIGGPWDGLPLLVFNGKSKPKKFIR
jgi:hypothetical protein